MKRFLALLLMSFVMPIASWAANDVTIKVNGLVCDFCAQSLDKVFTKQDEVAGIDVNLDDGIITVDMKDGKMMDDAALTKLVTDSGYNVVEITRGGADEADVVHCLLC